MNEPRVKTTGNRRRMGVLLLFATVLAASCAATPRERYELLSFFFDGVPDPSAPVALRDETGKVVKVVEGPQPSTHRPVVEARCEACHGEGTGGEGRRSFRGGSWEAVQKAWNFCDTCHSDPNEVPPNAIVISSEGRTHGPVALGECRRCHQAHQSRYPHLLRTERAETVCVTCHEGFGIRDGGMATMDCTECHDPHREASADDLFLRGGRARACAPCHELDTTARPWVHGPVAAGLCEACHDAHGTAGSERHVVRPLATACLGCHDRERLPADAGCAADAECDSCHEPHAAPRSSDLFLRDRIPAALPRFVTPPKEEVAEPIPAQDDPSGDGEAPATDAAAPR